MTYLRLTLNSDAAYNHKKGIGAWACWLESTDGSLVIKEAGSFKTDPGGSLQAELMAISNALALLQAKTELSLVKLTIKTDSLEAINMFQHVSKKKTKQTFLPMEAYIRSALGECKTWGMVHIPSHTFIRGHREYGAKHYERNHWCDRQAARQQYLIFKEMTNAESTRPHKQRPGSKAKTDKQRQETYAKRMARAGLTAYKRTKIDFSGEV